MTGRDRVSVPPTGHAFSDLGGKTVGSLIGGTAKITWDGLNGAVTGEIKKVESWQDFNPNNPEEQSGHYFPVKLAEQYTGEEITVQGAAEKKATDLWWVLRVDVTKKFTFKAQGETLFTLDFSGAEMAS